MTVVLDANVLYQALRSAGGASHFILGLIRQRKIRMALSVPVFLEYQDLLKREKSRKDLGLSLKETKFILEFIAYIAVPYTPFFSFRPNLKDESDNIYVELALTANAEYLITSNIKDFTREKELTFDDLNVVTPADFVVQWRKNHEK